MGKLSLGVLASGRGSNLQAIMDAIERRELDAVIKVVISDQPGAMALFRARERGIATACFVRKEFDTKEAFEEAMIETLRAYGVELVVLAGFMRVLSPRFIQAFPYRILNIHPSLLPAFPGLHAQAQAVEYGVRVSGCTVHFVDEGMDTGPIILQAAVPVEPDDTADTLAARILVQEHRLYPQAIRLFAEGRLKIVGRRVEILKGGIDNES